MKPQFAPRFFKVASLLFFILGTIRIFDVVFHNPELGYANSYDMLRMQSCLQIWPVDPSVPAGKKSPAAPLSEYRLSEEQSFTDFCVPSSELIFGYAGKFIVQILDLSTFPLDLFGAIRAFLISIMALLFLLALFRHAQLLAGLGLSLIYLIVISDPANTLYLNTFYYEFSALFFAFASLFLVFYICIRGETLLLSLLLAAALLLLSLSKPQHIPLACALLAGLLITNWDRLSSMKRSLFFSFLFITISLVSYSAYQETFALPGTYRFAITYANATDTFLGAILPAANDPYQAANILGLPEHCVGLSGQTWYTPGFQNSQLCPEVITVSRFKIVQLALRQPEFLIKATDQALPLLRPWTLKYIGSISGQQNGYAGELVFSISDWLDKLPDRTINLLFLLPGIAGILGMITTFNRRASQASRSLATIIVTMVLALYTVFYSSLFGDGYYEFQKHTHLYFSLYVSLAIILCCLALKSIWQIGQ